MKTTTSLPVFIVFLCLAFFSNTSKQSPEMCCYCPISETVDSVIREIGYDLVLFYEKQAKILNLYKKGNKGPVSGYDLLMIRYSDIPQADTVYNLYNIRPYSEQFTDSVVLLFSPDSKSLEVFQNETPGFGHELRHFTRKHDITVRVDSVIKDDYIKILVFSRYYVFDKLILFSIIRGMGDVVREEGGNTKKRSNIEFEQAATNLLDISSKGHIKLTYWIYFTDAEGEEKSHYWKFDIYGCMCPRFLGSGGDPIPPDFR